VVAAAVGARQVDLEAAAAAAAVLAGRKEEVEERMGLRDAVEEMLFTTARCSYLLRPLGTGEEHFLLMILDRRKSDLAAAQTALAEIAEILGDRVAVAEGLRQRT
jgi:predicted regulator of Ras-like GTPase activity (Roadblock/LC7/MglB family)